MSGNKPPPSSKPPNQPPQDLATRVAKLEKLLQEHFDERNQWNATLREWLERTVQIRLIDGHVLTGVLNWVDRYTLCIGREPKVEIVHKGAIATIKKDIGG